MIKLNVQKPARKYEALILLHPDTSESDQKAFFKKYQSVIKNYKGEFHKVETWGKRRLGNPIDNLKMGIYFLVYFEAQADAINELERTMRIHDKVLRFTHTRLDDGIPMKQHIENYQQVMETSRQRESDREAKAQARRSKERRPAKG